MLGELESGLLQNDQNLLTKMFVLLLLLMRNQKRCLDDTKNIEKERSNLQLVDGDPRVGRKVL